MLTTGLKNIKITGDLDKNTFSGISALGVDWRECEVRK